MPTLNEQTIRLVAWLKANPTDPPIREYALTAALPHSAYPALAVLPGRVRFAPNQQCASANVTLRIACCAGRPADAVAEAQALAQQLKLRIEASQNLGGLARHLAVGEIDLRPGGAALRGREQSGRQARGPALPGMAATEGRPTWASPVPATEPPLLQYAELELRLVFNQ